MSTLQSPFRLKFVRLFAAWIASSVAFVAVSEVAGVQPLSAAANPCVDNTWTYNSGVTPATCSKTFTYIDGTSTTQFTVPGGTSSLTVDVYGGKAGWGSYPGPESNGLSGYVGRVAGTLAVQASDVVIIAVGGDGRQDLIVGSTDPTFAGQNPLSGYDGGAGGSQAGFARRGQPGGAASVIRLQRGGSTVGDVVAGGAGGGSGGDDDNGNNGQTTGLARTDVPTSTTGQNGQTPLDGGGGADGSGSGGGGGGVVGGRTGTCSSYNCEGPGGYAGTNGASLLSTVTTNGYVAARSGAITITYTVLFTASMSPALTLKNGSSATFNLTFSHMIDPASLTTSDFSLASGAGVATGCSVTAVSGSAATYTVTVSGCTSDGTITPTLAANAITISSDASVPAQLRGIVGPPVAETSASTTLDNTAPSAPTAVDLAASSDTGTSSTDNLTKDNTPTMSATPVSGVVGETVTITASKAGSADVSCSYVLNASSCDLGTLTDGVWSVSAKHTDLAGNVSNASTPLSLTVDTSTTAGTPDLVAASDSGSSSTDNVTNDTTPTVSAVGATDGDTITMTASKAGSANVTCSYVKSPSVTSCDLGTLAPGDWAITSSATDPAGNTAGPTGGLTISVDTTPPSAPSAPDLLTASDLGTLSTDNLTSDNTPAMSAGSVPDGSTVTMTASKSGSANVTCTYVKSPSVNGCDLPTMSDGTWNVSATVADPAGNTSTSGPSLPVTIDTSAPSAPSAPDLLPASDSGASNTDNVTNDTTPSFSLPGGSNGDTITINGRKSDGSVVSCTYVQSPSVNSCDLPAMSDGSWTIDGTITDPSGNVSPAGPGTNMTVDSTPPAAPPAPDLLPASDTGSSPTDNVTNDATPAISGLGAADGDTVTVTATKSGGGTVTCSYVKSASVNSCDLPTMTDGSWAISTTNTDPAGNVSPSSTPLNMTLDTVAPSAPVAPDLMAASDTGTSNSDNLTNDNTPAMSAGSVPDGSTVTINGRKADGSTVSCSYVASATVTSCDLPTMSDGTWSMSAMVADPAGNVSPAGPSLDISIDATPPSAPSTPDLLPASDSGTSNTDNITSDSTPDIAIPGAVVGDTVAVVATSPSGKTVICTYVVTATVSSCTLGTLTDGSWKVVGTVTDPAGNTSPASGALDLMIDTTAPTPVAPDLLPASDNGASNSDNLTNDTTPAFGLPGAADGDIVSIVAKKDDGTTVTCSFTKSATVTSCDLQTLTDGNWSVNATVTDAAGNKSSAGPSMSLVIDTKPPVAPATPTVPTNADGQTGDPTPTLDVDGVTAGDTVTGTATNGSKSVSCVFVGAPGVRSCDLPLLTPGQWFISATVTDPAGNTSAASPQSKVEVVKVGLPANAASLKSVTLSGAQGSVTATATLKASELGKVANVVFVVKNADGTIARTLRVAAPTRSTAVATAVKGLVKGQRVSAYTENWLGVSASAPRGANVIRAATVSTYDKTGRPNLVGAQLLVSRIIFDPASPVLDDADKAQLDRIVWTLLNKGGLLLISGFARQNQTDTKNFLDGLSVDRAEAVANYLSARGVRAWIRFQGYGAITRQIGTWEDRKVEIRWVSGASELPTK